MGYVKVRDYRGGMADWKARGGAVAGGLEAGRPTNQLSSPPSVQRLNAILDALGDRSVGGLALLWIGILVGCAIGYWLLEAWPGNGLNAMGKPLALDADGLIGAFYFSAVTATSVGYGDIIPTGFSRLLANLEAVSALLIFGGLVSKFVSRRQEALIEEMDHRAFEDHLGRVRTNLHLMLLELHTLSDLCSETQRPERIQARAVSAATVFAGEMRAIHSLLYHPSRNPDEAVLETILTSLASGLQALTDVVECMPEDVRRSHAMGSCLRVIVALAREICGDCVPRSYAESLKTQMDGIQAYGSRLAALCSAAAAADLDRGGTRSRPGEPGGPDSPY